MSLVWEDYIIGKIFSTYLWFKIYMRRGGRVVTIAPALYSGKIWQKFRKIRKDSGRKSRKKSAQSIKIRSHTMLYTHAHTQTHVHPQYSFSIVLHWKSSSGRKVDKKIGLPNNIQLDYRYLEINIFLKILTHGWIMFYIK